MDTNTQSNTQSKTYTKKYSNRSTFTNSLKISKIMASNGISPQVLSHSYDNLEIVYEFIESVALNGNDTTNIIASIFINNVHELVDKMHALGYCHGDLHLGNIINGKDRVYLIDFDQSFNIEKGRTQTKVLNYMKDYYDWTGTYEQFVQYDYDNFLDEVYDIVKQSQKNQ